jgi:hypothetical protein
MAVIDGGPTPSCGADNDNYREFGESGFAEDDIRPIIRTKQHKAD